MPKSSDKTPKKKAAAAKASTKKKTATCSASQLLGIIVQVGSLHGGSAPRDMVARRAGYGSADNGSFKKALSRAAGKGLLDTSDKTVLTLTEEGRGEAGEAPPVQTNSEAHDKIKEELSAKMKEAFDLLKDGKVHHRSELAKALGYDSMKEQGFKKLLDRIRQKGYLENEDKENVQLSDVCFPNGRD